ncbi:Histamine H1 receptor [Halocaridina rubra]|uniref:Histamine H1 receptor n=1 Tax=Halocaridina rubra TaxID=373956 RepID=A0AAN8ZZP3_HALRR
MDVSVYTLTEIDTTPFKTYDEQGFNSSRKLLKDHYGMIPKYVNPSGQSQSLSRFPNCIPCNRTAADTFHIHKPSNNDHFYQKQGIRWKLDLNHHIWKLAGHSPTAWNSTEHRFWNHENETNWNFPFDTSWNITTLERPTPGGEGDDGSPLWNATTVSDAGNESVLRGNGMEEWSPGLLAVTGMALYTLALCTAVGNALVIHAIRTEKRLQTVSNLFIMSLAAADLTVGVIVMPISAAYAMMGQYVCEWRLGLPVCQFWLAADYTASTASIFNLVILSLDRYWSITAPLRYLRRRTRRRAWVMIGASWAAATAWLVPVLAWHYLALAGIRHHPPQVCETEFSNSVAFKAVTAALNFYLPSALMLYLYCRIFREIQTRQALGRVNFASHDVTTDSCSEMERASRHNQPPRNSQPREIPTITTPSERSQFRSLTLVTPGRHDCSHFSGVTVSVEYLPEESEETSPTLNHQYSNQTTLQPQSQLQYRRQDTTNRLSPHHNHIHCYQSSTRPHSSWNPSSDTNKWRCSWRFSSVSRSQAGSSESPNHTHTNDATPNETGRKRPVTCVNSSSSGGGRRIEGVNLAKERKAARQLGVIVGAFMACWVPYFTLFPIMALCGSCVPAQAHTATIWLGYLNSALNPVLYPLCNHNFRRAFARMLRIPTRKANNYTHAHRVATITVGH